ncbi:MAG TPA: recombination-associated protein RdgC [Rhodocyclaceae bacterium]|nr:recombination-associated protein RdgC [Rhodocyclaceae bacterium]
MWFRNLQLYRLPPGWTPTVDALHEQLSRQVFQACGSQDFKSRGWIPPRGDDRLVFNLERQWLLALGVEQKLLPASVIRQEAEKRANRLESEQGYRPGRKQLRDLREQVTVDLLPRAFSRYQALHCWIDPQDGWLAIDASSAARAEELLEVLGKSLDEFPLKRLDTRTSPGAAMAGWLAEGEGPADFSIDRECELRLPGAERSIVRYVRHPLDGGEIRAHLAAGKEPTRLAMTWQDRISFVLTEKLEIKRLAFLDVLKEDAEKQSEHGDEIFDIEFALMTGELRRLLPALVAALGGEAEKD